MNTSEVQKLINIPRNKLYYLELKGFICPRRIPKGDQEIRDYSDEDLARIRLLWRYLQMGYKHKQAYHKAIQKLKKDNCYKLQKRERRSHFNRSRKICLYIFCAGTPF